MASHDLNDRHRSLLVYGGVQDDLPDRGGYIFCSAAETGRMICEHQIVVNGLGNADEPYIAAGPGSKAGKLIHRIHGVVSSHIEEISDVHFAEIIKNSGIDSVRQILRELKAAGPQISGGRQPEELQLFLAEGSQICDLVRKEALNAVEHPIDTALLPCLLPCLYCAAEAGVYDGGGAAGLSDH